MKTLNEFINMKDLKDILNESKTNTVELTEQEAFWILEALATINFLNKKPGMSISGSDIKNYIGPAYKKIFDIASEDVKNDGDFGNGNIKESRCSLYD